MLVLVNLLNVPVGTTKCESPTVITPYSSAVSSIDLSSLPLNPILPSGFRTFSIL